MKIHIVGELADRWRKRVVERVVRGAHNTGTTRRWPCGLQALWEGVITLGGKEVKVFRWRDPWQTEIPDEWDLEAEL